MTKPTNFLTRFTAWTAPIHNGGLVRTMAEIQGEQERTRQNLEQRNKFRAKDVRCPAS